MRLRYERNRLIRQWIGFVIILAGFCVISFPFIKGYFTGKEQNAALLLATKQMEELKERGEILASDEKKKNQETKEKIEREKKDKLEKEEKAKKRKSESKSESESESETVSPSDGASISDYVTSEGSALESLLAVCKKYNENLVSSRQAGMNSLASTEYFDINTRNFGFTDNVIGTLWIPRLEIKLALYLGANHENMARGGAVFGKSSVPLGSGSVNTAIAGHRGWRGTAMFRDIQQIQMGDPIYIETPWEKLVYRVCELRIVPKDNNDWCKIQPGRNLITLMTCHPYTQNYQRYIVFGELSDEPYPTETDAKAEALRTKDTKPREVIEMDAKGNEKLIFVDTTSIDPTGEEYGGSMSNLMILADSQLRIVMYVVGGFAIVIFIWLIYKTVKYQNMKKER